MENKEEEKETLPVGWMNSRWSAASTALPSFSNPAVNQAPAFQPQFNQTNPNGNQWIQHQQRPQPSQLMYQVPSVHQYQY